MDGELVTSQPPPSYSEVFYEQFPGYLAIGMTEEQYFDGDSQLVKYYRRADKIRAERQNQQAWLQGAYFYDALARIAPVLHAYAKKGTKAKPYPDAPYPLAGGKPEKQREDVRERAISKKGLAYMQAYMARNNQRFQREEVSKSGND